MCGGYDVFLRSLKRAFDVLSIIRSLYTMQYSGKKRNSCMMYVRQRVNRVLSTNYSVYHTSTGI